MNTNEHSAYKYAVTVHVTYNKSIDKKYSLREIRILNFARAGNKIGVVENTDCVIESET